MDQKTYSCVLRFKGELLHSKPIDCATKHELQLLAFMHGGESVVDIKFLKSQPVYFPPEEGQEPRLVKSEMDEYKRLARNYDTLVNSGRGRKAVEECFRIRIEDFDSIVAEVDARESVARQAEEAEARAAIAEAAKNRPEPEPATVVAEPEKKPIGSRLFNQAQG